MEVFIVIEVVIILIVAIVGFGYTRYYARPTEVVVEQNARHIFEAVEEAEAYLKATGQNTISGP